MIFSRTRSFLILALFLLQSCSHWVGEKELSFLPEPTPTRSVASAEASCAQLLHFLSFSGFKTIDSKVGKALSSTYGERKGEVAKRNIEALLFIDYKDSLPQIMSLRDGVSELHNVGIESLYEHELKRRSLLGRMFSRDKKNLAFLNHREALEHLIESRDGFSVKKLKEAHEKLMRDNIDDIPSSSIGTFREIDIIGRAQGDDAISPQAFQELEKNPYIGTHRLNKVGDVYEGEIYYPSVNSLTPHVKEIVEQKDPELYRLLLNYEQRRQGDTKVLNEKLMNVLVEDLMDWFVLQRNQIGEIRSEESLYEYVKLVAEFQRNLVSIHPFRDGNGRTTRAFALYYPLLAENIPPPRLVNPNADIERSLEDWTEQILHGIEGTRHLYENIIKRSELGLPLELTPEFFAPYYPKKVSLPFRQASPRREAANYKEIDINPQQYVEHIEQVILKDDEMNRLLHSQPDSFFDEMMKREVSLNRRNKIFYVHQKEGEELVSLNLIDEDFVHTFGNQSYKNTEQWTHKMEQWYSDQVVWRGLSNRHRETSEAELLSMFKEVNTHFVSNNVASKVTGRMDAQQIKELAIDDFSKFNHDIVYDGIVQMARDHSETGPLYATSYGYSTSKNRTVGKAFAMGAMVVADYGKQQDFQHLLKSRVLVGMRRSNKDVDLGRLKQVRDEFSYRYGRQQEVMGIGAADPDSVMYVQTIDEAGSVIHSYVRNPENPKQIVVVEGEASEWPVDANAIIKRMNLD